MVDAVVSFAIEKLADFVTREVNIRIGVKDALLWLKDELGYLLISVRDAEDKQEWNETIRKWIDSVRDIANEAVILMERFSVVEEEHAEHGVLDRLRSCICICNIESNHYDIGKEVESLKERVIEIKIRRDEFGINDILAGHYRHQEERERIRKLRRTSAIELQEEVVGFEDDAKTLLAELLRDDPSLRLISIHGMGGLGKTTLARKLYNSSELMRHFDYRAWVCVSQNYNITHVLKVIISSMGHELNSLNNMDDAELFHHLRNLLDRRFLVVIDDIWDRQVWEKLAYAFPDMKNGSRIVLTTRNLQVAMAVDDKCFVHKLHFLSEDESWHLFCIRAKPTMHMEKLAREIVHECGGLPLAIAVVSGLLSNKTSYEEWSNVKYHMWRHVRNESLAIQGILSLSYDDLSSEMRQCFLYLARFPEDYTFAVDKLKMLWIAEGFISEAYEEDGIVMEDVAEDFLNELISRSMIQIVPLGGQVSLCRVHDLVRDLALIKAREYKVLEIFDFSNQYRSPISLLHKQPRHVIHNGIGEYLKLLHPSSDLWPLRSLTLFSNTVEHVELEEMKLIYTRFKYLEVLDLTGLESNRIPEEIGDLILLKFLGLTGNISSKPLIVPQTIGKLRKLQTLFGSVYSRYEFPREISEQKELRHLKFAQAVVNLKIGSTQTKLQSLETIQYSDWIHIDTVNFTNLYTLSIIDDYNASLNNSYGLNSLANLTCLQTVTLNFLASPILPTIKPLLFCKRIRNVTLKGTIKDPSELSFLPDSVTDLTLCSSKFTQDPMPILGSLLNLIHLHMDNVYTGKIMVCRDAEFPSLQTLNVKDLPNLEEWQVEDGALPSLKTFQINGCANLKIIPAQLKFGSSL